jgi:hypothetical protein
MKERIAFVLSVAVLAAIGCTTTSPEKKWAADAPPPLMKNADGRTELPATKLSDSRKRISADEIDESNYVDKYRLIDNDIRSEKRAMTKVGQ